MKPQEYIALARTVVNGTKAAVTEIATMGAELGAAFSQLKALIPARKVKPEPEPEIEEPDETHDTTAA